MSGHFICDSCGYEGHADWCKYLRPMNRRWLGNREKGEMDFIQYRRTQIAEMAPWEPGVDMTRVSVSAPDKEAGSPKRGDMIARNPKNHADMWLVAAQYFADNFEALEGNR